MSLINNPYNMADAQELAIQEDNNYQTEQEMIYDLIGCYYDMWDEIDLSRLADDSDSVTYDEFKQQAERFKELHKQATIVY